ncbi:MAG: DUF438 domain-containing protein [Atopobiaceae bacterium]
MSSEKPSRVETIKGYLERLSAGEPLESVKVDFVAAFSDVDPQEILDAEQQLLKSGTPAKEVQRLCDVHSALFHDACGPTASTFEAAEAAVERMLAGQEEPAPAAHETSDHPLRVLTEENDRAEEFLAQAQKFIAKRSFFELVKLLDKVRDLGIHYKKKGDLLYPQLAEKHDVIGPSQVMWAKDGEIKSALSACKQSASDDTAWYDTVSAAVMSAHEMCFKERNILLPTCEKEFSPEEWMGLWRDMQDYDVCFGVEYGHWEEAERAAQTLCATDGADAERIVIGSGSLKLAELEAMLNTIPAELTFVDANNINRYFNQGHKLFKRPQTALGRDVFSCHPPKAQAMVKQILSQLKSGERDEVAIWMEREDKPRWIRYIAVRDSAQNYVGCLEVVQDMSAAKEHFATS